MVAQWPGASLRQTAGVANQPGRPILCTLGGAVFWNPMGSPLYLVCFQISSLGLCLRGIESVPKPDVRCARRQHYLQARPRVLPATCLEKPESSCLCAFVRVVVQEPHGVLYDRGLTQKPVLFCTSLRELQDGPAAHDPCSETRWLPTPDTGTCSFCGGGAGNRISPSPLLSYKPLRKQLFH